MIYGHFSDETNLPYVHVGVVLESLDVFQLESVLDTGFSGNVKMNTQIAIDLGIVFSHNTEFITANGEVVTTEAAYGFVEMEGRKVHVKIAIADGVSLAGCGLFSVFGYRAVVDYKNRTAYLERV